jgi:hypothetical protein
MKEETKKKLHEELVEDAISKRNSDYSFCVIFALLLFAVGTLILSFAGYNLFHHGVDGQITYQTSPINVERTIQQAIFGGVCIASSLSFGLMAIASRQSGNRHVDYEKELYSKVVGGVEK